MKLISATIKKYKSIFDADNIKIDDKITTIVGMNESGKTVFLEALAKSNYFVDDQEFKFDITMDYPRTELKSYQKSGRNDNVTELVFELDDDLLKKISDDIGENVFLVKHFKYYKLYGNSSEWGGIKSDFKNFLKHIKIKFNISVEDFKKISSCVNINEINEIVKVKDSGFPPEIGTFLDNLIKNAYKWENDVLNAYIAQKWIKPNMPKFWYFDEYYELDSRININELKNKLTTDPKTKTARALFELADINIDQLIQSDNYEKFIAELEATSNLISSEIFRYWSTNANLNIKFTIDNVKKPGTNEFDKVLDIRVENSIYKISLPLKNRSKGFNWFFSFIVWFSKIQEDRNSNYILLLDEPGLNLHAKAQSDLLKYLEDLSSNYQIIYTTHSPFMIESDHLERVRTIVESGKGSIISDSIQEKDPNTLFPLQAALGYDIAQNLFISPNNLIVEGVSDVIILNLMSNILIENKQEGLKDDITIVPVGGMDKVVSFIALMKANKLKLACALDTFKDRSGKDRLDSLVKQRIIKASNVKFFDQFTNIGDGYADLEDMFEKSEYLKYFNSAFTEHRDIELKGLNKSTKGIINQICESLSIPRYNHYRPANKMLQLGLTNKDFSKDTLNKFETFFNEINKLF